MEPRHILYNDQTYAVPHPQLNEPRTEDGINVGDGPVSQPAEAEALAAAQPLAPDNNMASHPQHVRRQSTGRNARGGRNNVEEHSQPQRRQDLLASTVRRGRHERRPPEQMLRRLGRERSGSPIEREPSASQDLREYRERSPDFIEYGVSDGGLPPPRVRPNARTVGQNILRIFPTWIRPADIIREHRAVDGAIAEFRRCERDRRVINMPTVPSTLSEEEYQRRLAGWRRRNPLLTADLMNEASRGREDANSPLARAGGIIENNRPSFTEQSQEGENRPRRILPGQANAGIESGSSLNSGSHLQVQPPLDAAEREDQMPGLNAQRGVANAAPRANPAPRRPHRLDKYIFAAPPGMAQALIDNTFVEREQPVMFFGDWPAVNPEHLFPDEMRSRSRPLEPWVRPRNPDAPPPRVLRNQRPVPLPDHDQALDARPRAVEDGAEIMQDGERGE